LDYKNKLAAFSSSSFILNGVEIPIGIFMGIPIMEFLVNGQGVKFFLDTGAKRSYLPSDFTNSFEILGVDEDFFPMVGTFNTRLYEINTRLDNYEFNPHCASTRRNAFIHKAVGFSEIIFVYYRFYFGERSLLDAKGVKQLL
jgi:hypothetical protein